LGILICFAMPVPKGIINFEMCLFEGYIDTNFPRGGRALRTLMRIRRRRSK
jgi:hypothetical protein